MPLSRKLKDFLRNPLGVLKNKLNYIFWQGNEFARSLYTNICVFFKLPTYLGRRKAGQMLLEGKPQPTTIAEPEGFLILSPGAIAETRPAVEFARELIGTPGALHSPDQYKHLLQLPDQKHLDLESPLLKLALSEPLVSIATKYLGMLPILRTVDVWVSRYVPDEPQNSQLYHCDNEAVRQLKVFIFVNEITDKSGPFTLVSAELSKVVRDRLKYNWSQRRYRVTDEEMFSVIPKTAEVELVGAPETVAFVDTSRCFHFGSRLHEGARDRHVIMIQYVTPFAFKVGAGGPQDAPPLLYLDRPDLPQWQREVLGVQV